MEENTIEWLESEGVRVRLLLGEFGDGKTFFLDMVRQLLATEESVGKSAVSIYGHYIRKCLKRKFDRNFERDTQMLLDEQETIERIYLALCSMAYELWQREKKRNAVNPGGCRSPLFYENAAEI